MKLIYIILFCFAILLIIPATLAAAPSFDSLVELIEAESTEELRSVITSYPEAVHMRNQYNLPLIHRAAMTDKSDAVKVLLDAGAKLDTRDNTQRTPLHVAAGWSTIEMVQLLWSHGSDPNAITKSGGTPLDFAMDNFYQDNDVQRDKIVEFLKGEGAKMSEGGMNRQELIKEFEEEMASRPDKGSKPRQSEWDGSVAIVKEYVSRVTGDSSVKFHEWSKVTALGDKWAVRAMFEFKSIYGTTLYNNQWFYIRDGKVIGTKPAQ